VKHCVVLLVLQVCLWIRWAECSGKHEGLLDQHHPAYIWSRCGTSWVSVLRTATVHSQEELG